MAIEEIKVGDAPNDGKGDRTRLAWMKVNANFAFLLALIGSTLGTAGPPNVLTPGTVTTLAAGSPATVSITGTSPAQVINFGIPRGADGTPGSGGGSGPTTGMDQYGRVNPVAYGADPTGATSSTVAFQSALDVIQSSPYGGTLWIPPGLFTIDGQLNYDGGGSGAPPLTIAGVNANASRLRQTTPGTMIRQYNSFLTLRDFGIQVATSGSSSKAFDIFIGGNNRMIVENIASTPENSSSWLSSVLSIAGCLTSRFTNCHFNNVYGGITSVSQLHGVAIRLGGQCLSHTYSGIFAGGFNYGFFASTTVMPGMEGFLFQGCHFVGVRTGVYTLNQAYNGPQPVSWIGGHIEAYERCFQITKASNFTVSGGLFYKNGMFGLNGGHMDIDQCSNSSITGNTFDTNTANGYQGQSILINNSTRVLVVGNLGTAGSGTTSFVALTNGSSGCKVADNLSNGADFTTADGIADLAGGNFLSNNTRS